MILNYSWIVHHLRRDLLKQTWTLFMFSFFSFFCFLWWISVSVSDLRTEDPQPRQNVTLQCDNICESTAQNFWLRLVNITKVCCISHMTDNQDSPATCDGFQDENFQMSCNLSDVVFKIKRVNFSDSGFFIEGKLWFSEVHVNATGKIFLKYYLPFKAHYSPTHLVPFYY